MSLSPSISDLPEARALALGGPALPTPGRRRRREAGRVGGAEEPSGCSDLHLPQHCLSTGSPSEPLQRAAAGNEEEGPAGGRRPCVRPGKWAPYICLLSGADVGHRWTAL